MDHQALLRELETLALPVDDFDHQTHLTAAWAYRRRYGAREAAARCAYALSRFAMAKGSAQKYHHTLTMAILAILYSRMEASPALAEDCQAFLSANPDLLFEPRRLVGEHYSADRLACDSARRGFVSPDLKPLPTACLVH